MTAAGIEMLLGDPIVKKIGNAVRAHLVERQHVAPDPDALATDVLVAVARHIADVLEQLAEGHERRARSVLGEQRAANSVRAAHKDAAVMVRKVADLYRRIEP